MKKFLLLIFVIPIFCNGQEYINLFRIGYGQTFSNEYKDVGGSTKIKTLDASFTLPIPISRNQVFITGIDFNYNNLQLFPQSEFSSLYSTTLKLGMASKWSDKWSTTLVLLPKLASDYKHISAKDIFIGGIALIKLKKSDNLLYSFGLYATQEAFGIFTTPILGWYYLSPNKKFEMDMSLPIRGDVNYKLGSATIGVDYFGIGRSFNIHPKDIPSKYVDLNSVEFGTYLQFNFLQESVLARTKLGYSSNDYEVYAEGDKIDLGISAFSIGDDRTQLNPSLNGGVFIKLELIYRFHIIKSASEEKLSN